MSCNGWSNAETWVTSLHYDLYMQGIIEDGTVADAEEFKGHMIEMIEGTYPQLTTNGYLADLAPLYPVNWNELFESFSNNIVMEA
jgi:hypothetical protein